MNKTKVLILTTVFIDVVGIGIIVPILPFYVQQFSSSPFLVTSLFSVYSIFSFFSAPVIGAVSDKIGRKTMLILSIFSSSIGWFIFAWAPSIFFLFLGRIIDGAAAGNFPIAQAFLSDISKDAKERTANMGLIGAVFGVAFIIGPLLGGALGTISAVFPFYFVAVLALVNGILAIFFLPETHTALNTERKISINPFRPLVSAFKDKKILPNYTAWFLFGLAIASFQSIFALNAQAVFGYGQFAIGLIFMCIGVVVALNQTVILKHFWLKKFKEPTLELFMLVVFAAGFIFMSSAYFWLFALGLVATTFGQSVLRTVMNSQIAAKADPSKKGEVLGVTASITSLALASGPAAAGALFGWNRIVPFFLAAVMLLVAFLVLARTMRKDAIRI